MEPLITILDRQPKNEGLLTPALKELYGGDLTFFPAPSDRPYTIINFVTTLEGLTSFSEPERSGGGYISMFNKQDTFLMGLLRALSDGVAVGANTLREEPEHLWTSEFISPEHEPLFKELREKWSKKRETPLNIFVTGSGNVLPKETIPAVFRKEGLETLIVTTKEGEKIVRNQFSAHGLPNPQILAVNEGGEVNIGEMMRMLRGEYGIETLLIEGGSGFNGAVVNSENFDEKFITRSPIVIGTERSRPRPTFASGFARHAGDGILHNIVSIKVSGDYTYERFKRAV